MDYHGYYRFGNEVVLSYQIDGRPILESPQARDGKIVQRLEIGPGPELKLAVAGGESFDADKVRVVALGEGSEGSKSGSASNSIALAMRGKETADDQEDDEVDEFVAASVAGDTTGLSWHADDHSRLVLTIPRSDRTRAIEIIRLHRRG